MKEKFRKAIRITIIGVGCGFGLAEKAAIACNTLHQQAIKDILIRVKEDHSIYMRDKVIKEIAKENNIAL